MGSTTRGNGTTSPAPSKGFSLSPSLIRRAEDSSLLPDTTEEYYRSTQIDKYKETVELPPYLQSHSHSKIDLASQNGYKLPNISSTDKVHSWDPNWKILSSEKPPSNYRRDHLTDLTSLRSKGIKDAGSIHGTKFPHHYKRERTHIDSEAQSSSNFSTYGNVRPNLGSYSQKFSQGEPYLPPSDTRLDYINARGNPNYLPNPYTMIQNYKSPSPFKSSSNSSQQQGVYTYQNPTHTHQVHPQTQQSPDTLEWFKVNFYSPNLSNQFPDRSRSPSKITTRRYIDDKPPRLYPDFTHGVDSLNNLSTQSSKSEKSNHGDLGNIWMANQSSLMPEKKRDYSGSPDKLALLRKRCMHSDSSLTHPKQSLPSHVTQPVKVAMRRSQSVAPLQTGWTQKISENQPHEGTTNPNHPMYPQNRPKNSIVPEILSNLGQTQDSDDSGSVHNFHKRDNNYNNSKNVSNEQLNMIRTPSYISRPMGNDLKWDKSEDESKSCHDFNARLRHKSPTKKIVPVNISTPQRRQLSEMKTIYVSTEELKDLPITPNNKWLGELVSRLKISNNEWNMNLEALLDTRRLAKYHPSLLFHMNPTSNTTAAYNPLNLRVVVTEVIKLISSPRSSLAKHAALCLMDLYTFGGKKMDHVNDEIVPACLKKASQNSSDFLSEASYCVLAQMCKHVTPTKALSSILHATQSSRHQGYRTVGIKCIAVLIHRLKTNLLKIREISAVIDLLKQTISEASSEIRTASKVAIFLLIRYLGDRLDELIDCGILTVNDITDFENATSRVDEAQVQLILDPYRHTQIFSNSTSSKPHSLSYQPTTPNKSHLHDF